MVRPAEQEIWNWLEAVPDPEIPVLSVVDLGIVRAIEWEDEEKLRVTISPTYSGCPATTVIANDVVDALRKNGLEKVEISRQLSPPWTTDWISAEGRRKLEDYGIAPPQSAGGPRRCPRCKSPDVEKVSQFGSTPCKALWRCQTCLEPFDYFKCL